MPKKNAKTVKPVVIILDAKPDTPFYYVNYMAVSHGQFDFTIGAVRIPPTFTQEQLGSIQKGQPVLIEPTLQLVIPPAVARGLVHALEDQIQKYDNLQKVINEKQPQ